MPLTPNQLQEAIRRLPPEAQAQVRANAELLQARARVPKVTDILTLAHGWQPLRWQHHLGARYDKLLYQTGQRLLVHGPPQVGKSAMTSIDLVLLWLGVHPAARIRLITYSQEQSVNFSKAILANVQTDWYRKLFPATRLTRDYSTQEWSTTARVAAHDSQHSFSALGRGSGLTSKGGELFIIDDPYKNAEEAASHAVNEEIWDWYQQVLMQRINPDSNILVMFHRWKIDDFAGRLIGQGGWEQLRYPSICEELPDIIGRQLGEALAPEIKPLALLKEIREKSGERVFAGLHQGKPQAREGNLFKAKYLEGKRIHVLPAPGRYHRVRYWDTAGTEKTTGDFTSGMSTIYTDDGKIIFTNNRFGKWDAPERDQQILATADRDAQQRPTIIVAEQPPGAGKQVVDTLRRTLAEHGHRLKSHSPTTDKVARADPLSVQMEIGNVYIYEEPGGDNSWIPVFIEQLLLFPHGANDDLVDTATGSYNYFVKLKAQREKDQQIRNLENYFNYRE